MYKGDGELGLSSFYPFCIALNSHRYWKRWLQDQYFFLSLSNAIKKTGKRKEEKGKESMWKENGGFDRKTCEKFVALQVLPFAGITRRGHCYSSSYTEFKG